MNKMMTVGELIADLNKFDQNLHIGTADDFGEIEPVEELDLWPPTAVNPSPHQFVRIIVRAGARV